MSIPSDAIRKPAVAGQFYPAAPDRLQQTVDGLLDRTEPVALDGEVCALVAPHAGYMYSGGIAAASFKQIAGRAFETVFVLSPSHRDVFEGVSVYTGWGYETPLGVVPVDRERARALIDHDPECLRETELGHRLEHGIEVELPFLQRALTPGWRLVPVVMLDRSAETCARVARAITAVAQDVRYLVVASSDLYHGYSYKACHAVDEKTLASVEHLDPAAFARGLTDESYQACGGGPITVAMHVSRACGLNRAKRIAHTTSADVTGDRNGYVVGYGSVVFYREPGEPAGAYPHPPVQTVADAREQAGFTGAERKQLLSLARAAALQAIGAPDRFESSAQEITSPGLLRRYGVFVTIRHEGTLRGCIGNIHPNTPLYQTVQNMARAAATQDPRFPPISPEEAPELSFSISILNEMVPLRRVDDLQIGVHGLFVRRHGASGLLLPQVASERGWDRATFLEHVCRKAGLPVNAWQDPETDLFMFTTVVLGDDAP